MLVSIMNTIGAFPLGTGQETGRLESISAEPSGAL
jgi:hypothetical protein